LKIDRNCQVEFIETDLGHVKLRTQNKMKYLSLAVLLLVFACEPGKSKAIRQIKKEALEIHDEVMPKMGELRRTRKDLMLQANSLVDADSVRAQLLMAASDEIAAANESMMNWMRNYDPDFDGTEDEQLDYFQKQKVSIEEVKKIMNESLVRGKEVLGVN
jgi:small-conductance mechanosensitive channel